MPSDTLEIKDILERTAAEDHGDEQHGTPPERTAPPVEQLPPEEDAAQAADALRRQLAEQTRRAQTETQRRIEAERIAARATKEAGETRQNAVDANYTTVLTALDARNREAEALSGDYAAAMEAGDHRKAAEITMRIGKVGAAIEGLESAKQEMERQRQERLREPPKTEAAPAPAAPVADTTVGVPREQFLGRVNPTVADWLRGHDEFFTDQSFYRQCLAADKVLEAKGIYPNDPAYIAGVEGILGLTQSTTTPPPRQQQQQQQRSAPPPAAPPTRGNPTLGGAPRPSNGDVYISAEDRRVAEWLYPKTSWDPKGGVDPEGLVSERERLKSMGELPHRRR